MMKSLRGTDRIQVGGVFGKWDDAVGAQIAAHVRPIKLDQGTLLVEADTSTWATQVKFLADTIISRLRDEARVEIDRRRGPRGLESPSLNAGVESIPNANRRPDPCRIHYVVDGDPETPGSEPRSGDDMTNTGGTPAGWYYAPGDPRARSATGTVRSGSVSRRLSRSNRRLRRLPNRLRPRHRTTTRPSSTSHLRSRRRRLPATTRLPLPPIPPPAPHRATAPPVRSSPATSRPAPAYGAAPQGYQNFGAPGAGAAVGTPAEWGDALHRVADRLRDRVRYLRRRASSSPSSPARSPMRSAC